MGDHVKGSWVPCSFEAARNGRLPQVSVASGTPTTNTREVWVQVGAALSIGAAAAGRLGTTSTYAKIHVPMTEDEARRVPRAGGLFGLLYLVGRVIVGVWIALGFTLIAIGLLSSLPEDRGALLPGILIFGSGVAIAVLVGRSRYRRGRWGRARLDRSTGDLSLYVHPACRPAFTAAQLAATR